MKLKDEIAQHRYTIMRLRVRGFSTKPQSYLQNEITTLRELCTAVVRQRDDLGRQLDKAEGELIGYKKIVADQESIMTAQAMRIVDLKTHIENLEGEH